MNNDLEQNQKKPTFEEWLSTRTDTIESDCGCVSTETFYHWLKVAYGAKSPVIPDGWIVISKDMLVDYRDVKNAEVENYKAGYAGYYDQPGTRWARDFAGLSEELAAIDALLPAAPKPEIE